jgi:hypothetical protein
MLVAHAPRQLPSPPADQPARTVTQPARHLGADRSPLGVRRSVRAGVRDGVLLELDPRTDSITYPTTLVSGPVSVSRPAVTDSCLGVSRWGRTAYGGARP